MKDNIIKRDNLLVKSNTLALSRLEGKKRGLRQAQLFTIGLVNYDPESQTSTFTIQEFRELFDLAEYRKKDWERDKHGLYSLIYQTVDYEYLDDAHDRGLSDDYTLVRRGRYQNGTIILTWEFDLKDRLEFSQDGHYMLLDLSIISKFKHNSSWILYELLKTKYNKRRLRKSTLSIDELRDILGYDKKRLARYPDFKRFALDVAVEEINKHSELSLEYKPIYTGRKVTAIEFIWTTGNNQLNITSEQFEYLVDLKKELYSYRELSENDSYMGLRIVLETDLETLTMNTAKLVIKKCKKVLEKIKGKEEEDELFRDVQAILNKEEDELSRDIQMAKGIFS